MRRFLLSALAVLSASATPLVRSGDLSASWVFKLASPSIVTVQSHDKAGAVTKFGSGVVISKELVVSNCHVVANSYATTVRYESKEFRATLQHQDLERDLCSFLVEGLIAPPAILGDTVSLKVGDVAYAIGAPEGLELTLSGGLISGLRHVLGSVMLQVTTPISPGSSGGGLFDGQGRLIGLTSYYMKQGQQLNFALPVEWIKEQSQREASDQNANKRAGSPLTTVQIHGTVFKCQSSDGVVAYSPARIAGANCVALATFAEPTPAEQTAFNAVHVDKIEVGLGITGDQRVVAPSQFFAPSDTVYVSVSTSGTTSEPIQLTAKFTYQDGQKVNSSTQSVRPNGLVNTAFWISNPDGWPFGKYRVYIYLGNRFIADREFIVN